MKHVRLLVVALLSISLLGLTAVAAQGAADKEAICHKPGTPAEKTIEVATAAVPAHLDHGDHLGACSDVVLVDACVAINDPVLDGEDIESVDLTGLMFVGDEKVTLDAMGHAYPLRPPLLSEFSIYVKLTESSDPRVFPSTYKWFPEPTDPDQGVLRHSVELALPDGRFTAPDNPTSLWLGGWREGPQYLGWGIQIPPMNWHQEVTWTVACEHVPFSET